MKQNTNLYILFAIFSLSNSLSAQLSLLSDEFNNSTLDSSWNLYQTQYYDTPVPINNGFMYMSLDDIECNRTCVWWVDQNAGLIYKNVTGDFEVVTAVYAKQKSSPSQDVERWTQLAGLMARDPNSSSSGIENSVFNVAGMRFDIPSIELKSTVNNVSTIRPYTDNMSGTAAEVRMVREGSLFSLYSRPIGNSDWIFRDSFSRPDLPETLHVGLIAYVFEAYPGNLLAQFDYIRFSEVDDILSNPNFNNQELKIYPNPVVNELNIEVEKAKIDEINIYNILGIKVHQLNAISFEDNHQKLKLDISILPEGIYFLQIKNNNRSIGNYKFIKN